MTAINLASAPCAGDARCISSTISPLFKVRESHIREAMAAARGYNTYAAQQAASDPSKSFSYPAFAQRLVDLFPDRDGSGSSALATSALIEGARISIEIVKHPIERYSRYTHVQYAIVVRVTCPDGTPATHDFMLPEFFVYKDGKHKEEPYRVDSWYSHRAFRPGRQAKYRDDGGNTLFGKFIEGEWFGELFVYATKHQENDAPCIAAVKAALARAVLPGSTGGIHCATYRPNLYDEGAWRFELSLGFHIRSFWDEQGFTFRAPKLKQRNIIPVEGYRGGTGNIDDYRFVDGRCLLDVYTNGVSEEENITTIAMVQKALLEATHGCSTRAGWTYAVAPDGFHTLPAPNNRSTVPTGTSTADD